MPYTSIVFNCSCKLTEFFPRVMLFPDLNTAIMPQGDYPREESLMYLHMFDYYLMQRFPTTLKFIDTLSL